MSSTPVIWHSITYMNITVLSSAVLARELEVTCKQKQLYSLVYLLRLHTASLNSYNDLLLLVRQNCETNNSHDPCYRM